MSTKFIKNIILFSIIVCTSCVEKFKPDVDKYNNLLVVEGMITNEPGPYTIKLSISSPLDSTAYIPKTRAIVIILDNENNSETLTETKPGEYSTSASGIQGIIGRKYKIQIKTPENKTYSSDFEELLAPVGIDKVYSALEDKQSEFYYYKLNGLQFYVDTKLSNKNENYFLWRLESTFEYNSSFLITHIYDYDSIWREALLKPCSDPYMLYKCWRTDIISKTYNSNTLNLAEPKIIKFPLNYVSTENEELTIRYSLLVKQMTVSKKVHDFWHQIEELNYDQGSIFASLPYQVRGNIKCENNPEESVVGYFIVASIDEKRIFVDRPYINFVYKDCELYDNNFTAMSYLNKSFPVEWPIYITSVLKGYYVIKAWPRQECIDCTKKGGTTTKPSFWVD